MSKKLPVIFFFGFTISILGFKECLNNYKNE